MSRWQLKIAKSAAKQLAKMDRSVAARVIKTLEEIATLDDPTSRGKSLVGEYGGLWRYRIGDYRVICELDHGALVILALKIAHRSNAY